MIGKIKKPMPRQLEVLRLVASGLLYEEIAERMGISFNTVVMYVKRAKCALQAKTLCQAVAICFRRGYFKEF